MHSLFLFFTVIIRLKLPQYEAFQAFCKENISAKEQDMIRKQSEQYKKERNKAKSKKFHQVESKEFLYGKNSIKEEVKFYFLI